MGVHCIWVVLLTVQGVWCVPLGFGVSLGSSGGGGVQYNVGGSGGGVLGALGKMATSAGGGASAGMNLALQLEKAKLAAIKSGVVGASNAASNGLNLATNALKMSGNAGSKFAAGLKQSFSGNGAASNGWTSDVDFGASSSGSGNKQSSMQTSYGSSSSDHNDGVNIPSTDVLRTLSDLTDAGVDISTLVTNIGTEGGKQAINIGRKLGQEIMKNFGNSNPSWNSEYNTQGHTMSNDYNYDINIPTSGMQEAIGNMIGSAVDMADKGVQLGSEGAKIMPNMLGQTSSAVKSTVKGLLGNMGGSDSSSSKGSGGRYETTSITYKSDGTSQGGSSGSGYNYDVNIPTSGLREAMGNMIGSAVDMTDQGVQLGVEGAKLKPNMVGRASSAVKNTVKGLLGNLEGGSDSSSSKGSGSRSKTTSITYKSDGTSKGGSPGSNYNYDVNIPTSGVREAMGNMIGSAVDMADEGVQLGTESAKLKPNMVGRASSAVKNTVKELLGYMGGSDSSSSKGPGGHSTTTSITYKSDGTSKGGSLGSNYNYDVNIPTSGVRETMGNMIGSAVDMADQGVQLGVEGAKLKPNMVGRASSAVKNTVKELLGYMGDSDSSSSKGTSGHSSTTSIKYKSDGTSQGDSLGSGYNYDIKIPTSGVRQAMGNMIGSAVEMADQGVQMGAEGAKLMPNMLGQTSSAVKNTVKGLMGNMGGSDSSSSKGSDGHYTTTSITYNSDGTSQGGSSGSGYNYDVNIPTSGLREAMGNMIGSAVDMTDQGVQLGVGGAKLKSNMVGRASSAVKNTVKGLLGNMGGSDSSSSKGSDGHYTTTSITYNSDGTSQGGSSGSGYNYDVNIPTSGLREAMGNMIGSAVDMTDQGVQLGVEGAKLKSNMVGRASSAVKNTVKGLLGNMEGGSDSSSSKGSGSRSKTTSITYKSDGTSQGGSTGSGYNYDVNIPTSGIRGAMGNMIGSAVEMADQGVQLGTEGAKLMPNMVGRASSAAKNSVKEMLGSHGQGGSSGGLSFGSGRTFSTSVKLPTVSF